MGATVKKAAWNSNRLPRFPKAKLNVYSIGHAVERDKIQQGFNEIPERQNATQAVRVGPMRVVHL